MTVDVLVDEPATPWCAHCLRTLADVANGAVHVRTARSAHDQEERPVAAVTLDLRTGDDATRSLAWRVVRGDGLPLDAPHLFSDVFGRPDRLASVMVLDDRNRVLRRADLAAVGRSLARLRTTARRLATEMVAAAVRDHLAGREGTGPFEPLIEGRPAGPLDRLVGTLAHAATTVRDIAHTDCWFIGILDAPIHSLLDTPSPPHVRWVARPSGTRYRADPFARPDRPDEIWCERYDYTTRHGVLERMRLAGDRLESLGDIAAPVHRSFPFMTDTGEGPVAVPEASAGGQTTIYRLDPDGTLGATIAVLPVPGIDPVLFRWEGRVWLGLTRADLDNRSNLCLWHAPALAGPWTPHEGNPVKLDVRSSRGAGTPFVHEGVLYRPAQDCARTYGGRVTINRVLALTPTVFSEAVAAAVAPARDWPAPDGVHTISAFGSRTLIDAKREVLSARATTARVLARQRRR